MSHPPPSDEPSGGKVRAKLEGDCLKDDNRGKKTAVSPSQSRQVSMDDGALEEVGLLPMLGAECGQDNEGCVGDQRGELDAVREVGHGEE